MFVNLHSMQGRDALLKALETPSVRAVTAGALKVDGLLGMTDIQASAAFGIIRWAESGGAPKCPKCRSTDLYDLERRGPGKSGCWKCKECYHQFTFTSGTVLGSRKMPLRNYLFALSLVIDPSQFKSILHFTQELKLGQKSTYDLINKVRTCVTDENGCTVPFSLIDRAAWLIRRNHIRKQLSALKFGRVRDLNYPYLRDDISHADGADLLTFVSALVPNDGMPDYMRADMCQDMILAILSGQASRNEISKDVRKYISKVLGDSPWKYKWISMDAPLGGDNDGTLHDLIADPTSLDFAA